MYFGGEKKRGTDRERSKDRNRNGSYIWKKKKEG